MNLDTHSQNHAPQNHIHILQLVCHLNWGCVIAMNYLLMDSYL